LPEDGRPLQSARGADDRHNKWVMRNPRLCGTPATGLQLPRGLPDRFALKFKPEIRGLFDAGRPLQSARGANDRVPNNGRPLLSARGADDRPIVYRDPPQSVRGANAGHPPHSARGADDRPAPLPAVELPFVGRPLQSARGPDDRPKVYRDPPQSARGAVAGPSPQSARGADDRPAPGSGEILREISEAKEWLQSLELPFVGRPLQSARGPDDTPTSGVPDGGLPLQSARGAMMDLDGGFEGSSPLHSARGADDRPSSSNDRNPETRSPLHSARGADDRPTPRAGEILCGISNAVPKATGKAARSPKKKRRQTETNESDSTKQRCKCSISREWCASRQTKAQGQAKSCSKTD